MKIIGRKREIEELEKLYDRHSLVNCLPDKLSN